MRLGIRSYNPLVWALDALGVLPTPLLVAFWGMESSRALIAAVELGVFDALAEKPQTAEQLADGLDLDAAGTEALLNALNGFGYVKRRGGRYSLRRSAKRWLTSGAKTSLSKPFGLLHLLWGEFGDLDERVRSGGARDFHRPERSAEFWRRYEEGLGAAARLTAGSIARAVRFDRPPSRLLDVGGGHGMFSAAFCRRYPDVHATVLDLAPAAQVGRTLVAAEGLAQRIAYEEGDLLEGEWGSGYDCVLVFNVLHVLSEPDAELACRKAYDALAPGGTLVVVDSAHSGSSGDIDIVGGGSELLFYTINSTRAYSEERMLAWVRGAGFELVSTRKLLAMPEALITARRPA